MHSKCALADAPRPAGMKLKKCKIEHQILDGADHDEACAKCGMMAENEERALVRACD